ncbi:hypothetical protein FocTR4_00016283 [Fusarium oxysporum f. sp. cubense]|uniref:Uncharacterized protein n=1 Tax=Fusarium oxysporum f. sp. cubense TaxID=61366 RepID=A0A5C6SBN7_FUSOC|nr:hypothetical protein FocTR4_00016283 [Fusarium oxysporum f. sp. cubense]
MKADSVSMEGGGYYNENSNLQGQAIVESLELICPSGHQGMALFTMNLLYFEQVLPDAFVDAGFNFTALHWLRNMPDASSTPSSLSAAAHEDFTTFLSVRHKEVRQHGTMTICIPSDGEISVLPTFRCFETSLHSLHHKCRVDPMIARRLPMYFRTFDEILVSIAAVATKWTLKNHHALPLMHTSWSPEVIEASSEQARMSARKRYTDAVAGFALAACSQFFIDGLKPQVYHGQSPGEEAIRLKEGFMTDLTSAFKE